MYNEKAFLLPDSATSCACYHAKTENGDNHYKLTISDCNRSIRLHGSLINASEVEMEITKLENLIKGIEGMRDYLKMIKICKP